MAILTVSDVPERHNLICRAIVGGDDDDDDDDKHYYRDRGSPIVSFRLNVMIMNNWRSGNSCKRRALNSIKSLHLSSFFCSPELREFVK